MLRALWVGHSGALHAMLTGWCGDAQNASDVLQEVFRRLAESPSLMGAMKNPRAFLAVAARRMMVDFARRSATRSTYHAAAGAEAPAVENPGPTDENLRMAIKAAVETLPADQRSVFNHKILGGRTLEEIARLEGISLNTAASRLRYALDKIRGQLRPYYDDLNRSQFKNMKNDLNQDLSENKRIITPLEPKRVPSVVPGLEGLAALSADAGVSDAPAPEQAECYALPPVEEPAPEFVEPRIHVDPVFVAPPTGGIDPVFVEPPTGGIDPVPESGEELINLENVDGSGGQIPELVICEMFPPDGQIPAEWLKPIEPTESPEDFLVTIFEGEGETDIVGGDEEVAVEGDAGVLEDGEEFFVEGEGVPFDLESGFEICVLPVVPEEGAVAIDSAGLLTRYDAFLAENPDWGALDPDMMEAQVITGSSHIDGLEFGTPSRAAAFDNWYVTHFLGGGSGDGEVQDGRGGGLRCGWHGGAETDLSGGSAPPQSAEFMHLYDAFLADNPTWVEDNQGGDIQLQVITASGYVPDLQFGTPGQAAAFDLWYEAHHGAPLSDGDPGDVPTDISLISEPVYSEGAPVFRDGFWRFNGEIQPHWRSGGDQPEFAHGPSGVTPAPEAATPPVAANLSGGDLVAPASNAAADTELGRAIEESPKDPSNINPVALPDRMSVTEGIVADLPAEVAIATQEAAVVASASPEASSFGVGADRMMIVEFSVLSTPELPPAQPIPAVTPDTGDLPASVVHGGDAPDASEPGDAEAAFAPGADDALAGGAAAPVGAVAAPALEQHDATTVASGAVAIGSVAHGAARRPRPKL